MPLSRNAHPVTDDKSGKLGLLTSGIPTHENQQRPSSTVETASITGWKTPSFNHTIPRPGTLGELSWASVPPWVTRTNVRTIAARAENYILYKQFIQFSYSRA